MGEDPTYLNSWNFAGEKGEQNFFQSENYYRDNMVLSDIIAPESFRHRVRTALPDVFVDV